jgi:rhodanese-related sulfurtransferase
MKSRVFLLYISIATLMVMTLVATSFAASVSRMTTEELNSRLSEDGLVVLDVRSPYHWGSTDKKILGADRVGPGGVADWASNYSKEETLVLYCA